MTNKERVQNNLQITVDGIKSEKVQEVVTSLAIIAQCQIDTSYTLAMMLDEMQTDKAKEIEKTKTAKLTKEEFRAKAKEVVDSVPFSVLGKLFEYENFVEMRVAYIPDGLGSAEADLPLVEFLDKLYEQIEGDLKGGEA